MKKLLLLTLTLVFFQTLAYAQPTMNVSMDNSSFLRYDIVSFKVNLTDNGNHISNAILTAKFYYNNNLVTTVGNMNSVSLYYNSTDNLWHGYWPIPWDPALGVYTINVTTNISGNSYYQSTTFNINMRQPKAVLPPGYLAMLAENIEDLTGFNVPGPNGEPGNWTNMFKWADFMGADSFWPTNGYIYGGICYANVTFPWCRVSYQSSEKYCQEANRTGLQCAPWIWPYSVGEPDNAKTLFGIEYNWTLQYNCGSDSIYEVKGDVSSLDDRMIDHTLNLINIIKVRPEVTTIGFDWEPSGIDLRLVNDEFVKKMNFPVPSNWDAMTEQDRMKWVGRRVTVGCSEYNATISDIFSRWVSTNYVRSLKSIIDESNTSKSFFMFTMPSNPYGGGLGRAYGQDPFNLYDAGIDIIAPMLYFSPAQAKRPFDANWPEGCWYEGALIHPWGDEVKKAALPNIVGGQITLDQAYVNCYYQKTRWYPAPLEMYDRMMISGNGMYMDGSITGLFWHDILRDVSMGYGTPLPYSAIEYAVAGGAAASDLRLEAGRIPINMSIEAPSEISYSDTINGNITVKNIGSSCLDVNIFLINNTPGWNFISAPNNIVHLCSGNTATVPFTVKSNTRNYDIDNRFMIAAKSTWSSNQTDTHLEFKYVHVIPKSSVSGRLKDKNGTALDSKITLYQNNNLISSNKTDFQGNYYMFVPSGTYDIEFNLTNFYIINYSIRLKDVDVNSDVLDPIKYINTNISGNQISIAFDANKTQTLYINSKIKPTRILKNNSILAGVSSLSNLSTNEWFYNETEQKIYLMIDRFLSGFEPLLGKTDVGEDGTGWPVYLYTTGPYDVNTTANVSSIYVYTPAAGKGIVALYDGIYNANQYSTHYNPNNLLVQSGEENCLANSWHAFSIPLTQIQPGEYFIALKMNSDGMISETARDGFGQWITSSYSSPFPNPFGTVQDATGAEFSAYACCG